MALALPVDASSPEPARGTWEDEATRAAGIVTACGTMASALREKHRLLPYLRIWLAGGACTLSALKWRRGLKGKGRWRCTSEEQVKRRAIHCV